MPTMATWGFWTQEAVVVARTYLAALGQAGAHVLVIPPAEDADAERLVAMMDGLVLAGGTDIEPDLYGGPASDSLEETRRDRDLFELRAAKAAFDLDLPVLGICRGLQILNVAAGGTLHQHLLDHGFAEHRPVPGRLDASTNHLVAVEPDSLLARCGLPGVREVNSHHHQGVAMVGAGGRVVARSVPDNAVEAVEWPAQRFVIGVQWHPEDPPMHGLFDALVQAAAETPSRSQSTSDVAVPTS